MEGKERKPTKPTLSGTAGAVPVRNEKGEISMQKVKVQRYVAGKRPDYAATSDNEEEMSEDSDHHEEEVRSSRYQPEPSLNTNVDDRRLKRLMEAEKSTDSKDRPSRHRLIAEPVVLKEEEQEEEEDDKNETHSEPSKPHEESDEEEVDEDERMRKRMELRKKALQARQEELMKIEEEAKQDSEDEDESETEESEYEDEEYSDSDGEMAPRLKPVFVRKTDRVTIQEKEALVEKEKEIELERERLHQESKKQTKKIIEEEVNKEKLAEKETDENIKCDFETDDENNEEDYEAWKLRELRRMKRDRDQREAQDKEKEEIQKLRNMTEEERLAYFKANPKFIDNQRVKGKYKFLQKYYHRGAFFMDEDDEVFKRNFSEPTLEDHFDKKILPKVMQVKNFGMSGRTKYTHLMDQDTTAGNENPWANQEKFISGKGGGTKQVFDKPTAKKRK